LRRYSNNSAEYIIKGYPPFFHASLTAVMFQLIQLDSAQSSLVSAKR
jgi:hypothetical protein